MFWKPPNREEHNDDEMEEEPPLTDKLRQRDNGMKEDFTELFIRLIQFDMYESLIGQIIANKKGTIQGFKKGMIDFSLVKEGITWVFQERSNLTACVQWGIMLKNTEND